MGLICWRTGKRKMMFLVIQIQAIMWKKKLIKNRSKKLMNKKWRKKITRAKQMKNKRCKSKFPKDP